MHQPCGASATPNGPVWECALPMVAGQRMLNDRAAQDSLTTSWNHRYSLSILGGGQTTLREGGGWWLSEALSIKPLKTISQTIYILISTEIQATNLANLKKEFLCQHYYILVFNLVLKRGSSGVPLHGYPFQLLDSTSRQVTHSYRASVTSSVKWNHASYLHCGFVEQIRWDSVHIALSSVPGTFHGLRELEFLPVVSVGEALVSCYERFKSPSISFIKSLTIFQGEWETKGI